MRSGCTVEPANLPPKALLIPFPVFVLVLCCCQGSSSLPGVTAVWAVDESEKVRQDDLDHWAKANPDNHVWDGRRIHVEGARNEVIGFQVIIEAEGTGARNVDVMLDSLRHDGYVLKNHTRADGPYDFVGTRIELFLESYVEVTERSEWWFASARPLPDRAHLGWIPDALVPAQTRGTFEHGTGGAPFQIGAQKNQAVWVDIFIPPDAPAGEFSGTFRVLESHTTTFSIPVKLTVYDFALPDTTHMHTHFFWGWPTIPERHGPEKDSPAYWSLFDAYMKTFHRHRLDLTDGVVTLDTFRVRLAGYYTGESYAPHSGYDGPGVGIGNQTYSIGTYDQPSSGFRSGFTPDTPEGWSAAADAWEEWFRAHAPAVVRFKYLDDEPPYSRWPEVREKALWIRLGKGVGRSLNTLVTTRIGEELFGAITFWSVTGHSGWNDSGGTTGFDIHVVPGRRATGERVGFYNGQRPSFGDPGPIDNFAADARVNPWIAWKYGADLYSFWEVAYYASGDINVWQDPRAGGMMVYTGEDRKHPRDSRGLKGPIASIRMKNLRRGVQDYEYLWLASRAGIPVNDMVDAVVPSAFNDYNGTTFTSQRDQPLWATRGYEFERSRRVLARRLEERLHRTSGGGR
jgi:hypothetical protein